MCLPCTRILAQNLVLTIQVAHLRAYIECMKEHRRYCKWTPYLSTRTAKKGIA